MEKSFRGQKHICSNCNTKFFDFNKEKIICPNCKTEKVMQKKAPACKKIDNNFIVAKEGMFINI